jgi:hypothetical protein
MNCINKPCERINFKKYHRKKKKSRYCMLYKHILIFILITFNFLSLVYGNSKLKCTKCLRKCCDNFGGLKSCKETCATDYCYGIKIDVEGYECPKPSMETDNGPGTKTAGPGTARPGTAVPGTAVSGTAVSGTAVSGTAVSGTAVSGTAVPVGTGRVPGTPGTVPVGTGGVPGTPGTVPVGTPVVPGTSGTVPPPPVGVTPVGTIPAPVGTTLPPGS